MPLNDTYIRSLRPKERAFSVSDGLGLSLFIQPSGAKWWRLRYRYLGKANMLSLGTYPDTSLKDAREKREEARKLLASGIDPSQNNKEKKIENLLRIATSFETVAVEWHKMKSQIWSPSHARKIIRIFERDIFKHIGKRPISEISAPEILAVLRKIEARGVIETAHSAKSNISQVMRYAVSTGRAERDPCPDLRGALPPIRVKHMAAITDPDKAGELLRAIDGYEGTLVVQCALKLAPLFFCRPGELRHAKWSDIDFSKGEWSYIVTKTMTPHLVPLATQAITILQKIKGLTGDCEYVFPGAQNSKRPMSDAAINAALRRMGYDTQSEITGHGFRAMARTILAEQLHQRPEVIEHQLSHKVPDALGTAYNRTKILKDRREMMQLWADYLDQIKKPIALQPKLSITDQAG